MNRLDLPSLDGTNPLGFLAALGTLAVLAENDPSLKLGWRQKARWTPFLESAHPLEKETILNQLAAKLPGRAVDQKAKQKCEASQKRMEAVKARLKEAEKHLKTRNLRGNQLRAEKARLIEPLRKRYEKRRGIVLKRRILAVPSPELSIGLKIDLSADEFRAKAESFLESGQNSSAIALLSGLASESCNANKCQRTDFDFVDSSGRLAFLEAVLNLMRETTPERLDAALFSPWKRADERFSLRFDPVEDRRYALLDRDPTANDNKSTTEWMANLLAYRALSIFPCVITSHGGAKTVGWSKHKGQSCFTWPLWKYALPLDTVRALLTHPELHQLMPMKLLRHLGVRAVYRAFRITNGDYVNFSPATAV